MITNQGQSSRVAERRKSLGLSQEELSRASHLSRQLVSAVETGRHVPSVKAAMALARALDSSVEDLFGEPGAATFVPVLGEDPPEPAGVLTVRVGSSISYHPLSEAGQSWTRSDGLYRNGRITLYEDGELSGAAIAGCDPALGLAASVLPNTGPRRVVGIAASSGKAVRALDEERIHGAVVHGLPGHLREPARRMRRFTLARWRVGLACKPGAAVDLERIARGELTITRRDPDAEVSKALQRALTRLGGAVTLKGPAVSTHLDAARRVGYGSADVAITMEAAARVFDLEFVELEEHVSQLQVDDRWVELPAVSALIDLIGSGPFRARLDAVGGYDVSEAGKEL